ncbi:MAG: polyprenyl diphosphate synthase [Methanomicrobiales archaeon]|nr:polyprenyl diphosphate synthase [Methanomicrobiales archaeon]
MKTRTLLERIYEWYLKSADLHIPRHIAVIQDGNRRYAREQGIALEKGHHAGAETTERLLEWASELGLKYITLFCFSTENFSRKEEEMRYLFSLFKEKLAAVVRDPRVHRNGIRVQMLGDRSLLPEDLLAHVEVAEEATKGYSNYFVNLALGYGGRNEIVHAAREILQGVRNGRIGCEEIDAALVGRHLKEGALLPPVDLVIRTGNEKRTSNFLPWLANGNESAVYFCAPNWPQFRKIDLLRAIRLYDQRMKLLKEM